MPDGPINRYKWNLSIHIFHKAYQIPMSDVTGKYNVIPLHETLISNV